MDKISVIVPVYKVKDCMDRCIASIIEQTYSNLEIILVDDGSPDECGQLCEAWSEKDSRIEVIHKKNGGLSDARNAGLSVATGDYISFIDSDDYIDNRFYEILLDALNSTNADIAECDRNDIYNNDIVVTNSADEISIEEYSPKDAMGLLIENRILYQTVWNKLYKKSVIADLVFEKGKIHEDEFFTWQVFARCEKIAKVKAALYNYVHRENSIMEQKISAANLDCLEARLIRHEYIINNIPEFTAISKMSMLPLCIYLMQRCLKTKDKAMIQSFGDNLQKYYDKVRLCFGEFKTVSLKMKVWISLANISVILCARVRNLLGKPC